jgi:anti-sigma factor RsiW
MSCQEVQVQYHAYLDGELELTRSLEVEQHLRECALCSQALDGLRRLQRSLKHEDLIFHTPPNLAARVRAAVRQDGAVGAVTRRRWSWLIPALSVSVVVIVLAGWWLTRTSADDLLASEVVSSHVRSLMTDSHLIDVPSEDPHTVKPWFDGKLDFSPPVKELPGQGFVLTGGRLDYIAQRPVAALVYQRRKHVINVFIWPAIGSAVARTTADVRQGYNLIHWTKSGMTYWIVSDLNLAELQQFAEDLQN